MTILHHFFATKLQTRIRRYLTFGHARSSRWMCVRNRLLHTEHIELICYPNIRREWRQEPECWWHSTHFDIGCILAECREGFHGQKCNFDSDVQGRITKC
jgi:hypothetical protein